MADLIDGRPIVLKVHGCVTDPEGMVLTRREHDTLAADGGYRAVTEHLITHCSMLFVGYGMKDPFDLDRLLYGRTELLRASQRVHFVLIHREEADGAERWARDYNVHPIVYEDHASIAGFLRALGARPRTAPAWPSLLTPEEIETVAGRAGVSSAGPQAAAAVPSVEPIASTPAARRTADGHRVIASWVHLSDIHFGHGGAAYRADQRLILDALEQELRSETPGDVPPLDMMLITGDIAFSGAAASSDEYDVSLEALTAAAGACGLSLEQVYAVPGNHDVNGKAITSRRDQKAFLGYREHANDIDDALADADMRAVLHARQANYLAATERLAPACRALYWQTTVGTDDRPIRLVGLNTALLADVRGDHGKLQLGKHQLTETMLPIADGEIVIVLSHHPLSDRWLRDEKHARNFVRGRAHVHLCGHVHDAETTGVKSGRDQQLVTIAAGATHDEDHPGAGHGFSYGAIIETPDGYAVRVWPRIFSKKQHRFVRDPDGIPDGQAWADHRIQE